MILVTGAAGFIGSCMVTKLNRRGHTDIILADDFNRPVKRRNLFNKKYAGSTDRMTIFDFIDNYPDHFEFIYHLGARTDTTEMDTAVHTRLNLEYSKRLWHKCVQYQIPIVYASSAATYGDGSLGYKDDHDIIPSLQPLNPYGVSKNEFDKWVLLQKDTPPFWAGLKFFNVFGPNEYHKSRMASVVLQSYKQIVTEGRVKLFKSHKKEYQDGEQLRDFIYVKDVIDVLWWMYENRKNSGIYNLGTGKARTFLDLTHAVFHALQLQPYIEYIDTPIDIRDKYQYYTEANMYKLKKIGYDKPFTYLEEAITEYVKLFLSRNAYF